MFACMQKAFRFGWLWRRVRQGWWWCECSGVVQKSRPDTHNQEFATLRQLPATPGEERRAVPHLPPHGPIAHVQPIASWDSPSGNLVRVARTWPSNDHPHILIWQRGRGSGGWRPPLMVFFVGQKCPCVTGGEECRFAGSWYCLMVSENRQSHGGCVCQGEGGDGCRCRGVVASARATLSTCSSARWARLSRSWQRLHSA